jgi:hypothetical protein
MHLSRTFAIILLIMLPVAELDLFYGGRAIIFLFFILFYISLFFETKKRKWITKQNPYQQGYEIQCGGYRG